MSRSRPSLLSLGPGLLLLSLALTALLYGRALFLPFFFDDLDHIPYIAATNLVDLWRSSGGFPYYRPLGNTVWRLIYVTTGDLNPVAFHGVNLFFHVLNGWLAGRLALSILRKIDPQVQRWTGVLATAFYVAYPFSYQAVPWVGALYHLLVTTLTLTAVWATLRIAQTGQSRWRWVATAAAAAAPFAHENGVMLLLLLPAVTLLNRSKQQPISWTVWLHWIAPFLFWLIAWISVPKGDFGGLPSLNLEAVGQNLVYFFQGLVYPTTILTGRLVAVNGWPDFVTIFGFGALSIFLTVSGWRAASQNGSLRQLMMVGLTWWAVTALPALIFLDFAYVLSSPRLLVLPGVGITLVWSGVAGALWQRAGDLPWIRPAVMAAAAYILAASSWMIVVHLNQHAAIGRIWHRAADITVQANRPGLDTVPVFVNFPTSIAERIPFFPLGHEGTVFMIDYIPQERILEVLTNRPAVAHMRSFEDIRPQRDYIYLVMSSGRDWPDLLQEFSRIDVWLIDYLESDLQLRQIGSSITPTRPTFPIVFEQLDTALLTAAAVEQNGEFFVDIVWQVRDQPPPFEWVPFVHLLGTDGRLIAQGDGDPWGNTFPLGQWSMNSQHIDRRIIELENPEVSVAALQVGLYHRVTGERALMTLPDGVQTDALPIPIGTTPLLPLN